MKWGEVRAGDLFVSRDASGLNDPEAWLDRTYLVLTVDRSRSRVSVTVLAPDGTVSPPWDGGAREEYYDDVLVGRGE